MKKEEKIDLSKLKDARLANDLTQAEISKQLGVNLGTYRTWEYEASHPNEENTKKLMELLPEIKKGE